MKATVRTGWLAFAVAMFASVGSLAVSASAWAEPAPSLTPAPPPNECPRIVDPRGGFTDDIPMHCYGEPNPLETHQSTGGDKEPKLGPGYYAITFTGAPPYIEEMCLKTDTTINNNPRGRERVCSGRKGSNTGDFVIAVPYTPGDTVYLDWEQFNGIGTTSNTQVDIIVTGATTCKSSGLVDSGKLQCDTPPQHQTVYTPPPIAPFTINVADVNDPVIKLLNVLGWCVTAAAVFGLLVVAIVVATQVRHGTPGEGADYWRQVAIIAGACLLATSAGPVLEFLGFSQ